MVGKEQSWQTGVQARTGKYHRVDKFQKHLFNTVIELDDKMQESHIVNIPVIHYAKESTSAQQYLNLAKEVAGELT